MIKEKNVVIKNSVILNLIQDLQRLIWLLRNCVRGRFQIKFGMTNLFNKAGFTLIELLVVVLIIGILAAIALPQYQKAVEKARVMEAITILKEMDKAQQLCTLEHGFNDCTFEHFFENSDYVPPTPLLTSWDECLETAPCFHTQDWECFSDDWLYCGRLKNGRVSSSLLSMSTSDGQNSVVCLNRGDDNYCSSIGM